MAWKRVESENGREIKENMGMKSGQVKAKKNREKGGKMKTSE